MGLVPRAAGAAIAARKDAADDGQEQEQNEDTADDSADSVGIGVEVAALFALVGAVVTIITRAASVLVVRLALWRAGGGRDGWSVCGGVDGRAAGGRAALALYPIADAAVSCQPCRATRAGATLDVRASPAVVTAPWVRAPAILAAAILAAAGFSWRRRADDEGQEGQVPQNRHCKTLLQL